MLKRLISTVREYVTKARQLSKHGSRSFPHVLMRLLISRVFYGMGPGYYDCRRFEGKRLSRVREYIPLHEREDLQRSLDAEEERPLVLDKALLYQHCLEHFIPAVPVLGVFSYSRTRYEDSVPVVRTHAELKVLFSKLSSGTYIVKPTCGGHGHGVKAIRVSGQGLRDFLDQPITLEQVSAAYVHDNPVWAGFIIQRHVTSHPLLKSIMPGPGLGTIRVVTFLGAADAVDIAYAICRLPVGSNIIDNFSGGVGNWVAPIGIVNGRFGNAVGRTESIPVFTEIACHPQTGVRFKDVVIPEWSRLLELVRTAARSLPHLRTVGWDIAVTPEGPKILEANWDWGADVIEVALNRGIKQELTDWTKKSLQARDKRPAVFVDSHLSSLGSYHHSSH